jgi:hypothetical protein
LPGSNAGVGEDRYDSGDGYDEVPILIPLFIVCRGIGVAIYGIRNVRKWDECMVGAAAALLVERFAEDTFEFIRSSIPVIAKAAYARRVTNHALI